MIVRNNWEKERSKQTHFTQAEKDLIKRRFGEGKSVTDTARELKASSRTIGEDYSLLRLEGFVPKSKITRKPADYAARLYKPVWDL
jgi:hypothetical protein